MHYNLLAMKVSVVIPAYNEEQYIEKCLKSIAQQIEKPDEIIVVDNNCTDKTAEIARKLGAIIVTEKKQGMIFARNTGFNTAKCEIIAKTDADAIAPKDWISRIKIAFKNPEIGGYSGPVSFFTNSFMSNASSTIAYYIFKIVGLLIGNPIMLGPNTTLRKYYWEKIKNDICLSDKDVHEDIDISIHLGKITKIRFDKDFVMTTRRGRWIKIFTEYIVRLAKMLLSHRDLIRKW